MGRLNILDRMEADIPQDQSALHFFMDAILICYGCSQVFEIWHIFKEFISFFSPCDFDYLSQT
jgi:hypothetical protein